MGGGGGDPLDFEIIESPAEEDQKGKPRHDKCSSCERPLSSSSSSMLSSLSRAMIEIGSSGEKKKNYF